MISRISACESGGGGGNEDHSKPRGSRDRAHWHPVRTPPRRDSPPVPNRFTNMAQAQAGRIRQADPSSTQTGFGSQGTSGKNGREVVGTEWPDEAKEGCDGRHCREFRYACMPSGISQRAAAVSKEHIRGGSKRQFLKTYEMDFKEANIRTSTRVGHRME